MGGSNLISQVLGNYDIPGTYSIPGGVDVVKCAVVGNLMSLPLSLPGRNGSTSLIKQSF